MNTDSTPPGFSFAGGLVEPLYTEPLYRTQMLAQRLVLAAAATGNEVDIAIAQQAIAAFCPPILEWCKKRIAAAESKSDLKTEIPTIESCIAEVRPPILKLVREAAAQSILDTLESAMGPDFEAQVSGDQVALGDGRDSIYEFLTSRSNFDDSMQMLLEQSIGAGTDIVVRLLKSDEFATDMRQMRFVEPAPVSPASVSPPSVSPPSVTLAPS